MKILRYISGCALLACEPGAKTPQATDDTDVIDPCAGDPEVTSITSGSDCEGTATCTWTVEVTRPVGGVSVRLDETGDPASQCVLNDCNAWSETHTLALSAEGAGTDGCGQTWSVTLDVADSFQVQVDSSSTLFNQTLLPRTTQLARATAVDTSEVIACLATGEDPSFFEAECPTAL